MAVLRRVFAEQDRNGDDRDTKVVVGFKFRADQEITSSSKVHPELIPPLQGRAALHDCTLQCFWDATGMQRAVPPLHVPPVLTDAQKKDLRAELIAAVEARSAAAGGTERLRPTVEIDHSMPCWLITFVAMQLFGTRKIGDLLPADKLWLSKVIKSLHNGFKNAMMVDTSRNQWHIWLSLLLAMGFNGTTSAPRSVALRVTRVRQHSHTPEMIDFVSCFEPQSLAVDAATMRDAFHSYAYELYLIGNEQDAGSKRQQAVVKLAEWIFDRADGARLTMPLCTGRLTVAALGTQTSWALDGF